MQKIVYAALIVTIVIVNCYLFPPEHLPLWIISIVGFVASIALICCKTASLRNMVTTGCLISAWLWIMMNFNFYPQLLTYQAGNEMARFIHAENIPAKDIALYDPDDHSYSFDIAMQNIIPEISLEEIEAHATPAKYLFVEQQAYDDLLQKQIPLHLLHQVRDYRITRLTPRFLSPSTRAGTLSTVYLLKLD